MKSFQAYVILGMLVLLFAAGKEMVAAGEIRHSCTEPIMMSPCKKDVCMTTCKNKHGHKAFGICFGGGCLCTYPCPSS
ncbi:hypothetical protein GQ457_08G006030 [Hibiscus cannabinus]